MKAFTHRHRHHGVFASAYPPPRAFIGTTDATSLSAAELCCDALIGEQRLLRKDDSQITDETGLVALCGNLKSP